MRSLTAGLSASERMLTILSLALVAGAVVEVVFLRMFARAGIYIFQDNSAAWLYTVYSSLTWLGNSALNFVTILASITLLALAMVLWRRGGAVFKLTSVAIMVILGLEGALFLVSSNPGLSLAYFGSSAFLTGLALVLWWRCGSARQTALTLGPILAMFLASYWYKIVPLLHQLGGTGLQGSVVAFQLSEGMLLLFAISLLLTIGVSRRPKVLGGATLLTLLLIGVYLGNPDMVPLISTWAFGITMYLPFWLYVLALWCTSAALLTLLDKGYLLLGCALALLFISHRMLPLTYFNSLTLIALLLIVTTSWPAPRPLGQWRLWGHSFHGKASTPFGTGRNCQLAFC